MFSCLNDSEQHSPSPQMESSNGAELSAPLFPPLPLLCSGEADSGDGVIGIELQNFLMICDFTKCKAW